METTDVGLASYIYSLGKDVQIDRSDPWHCVFSFEDCQEVREWQSGQAMVNGLVFLNSYKTIMRKVKEMIQNVSDKVIDATKEQPCGTLMHPDQWLTLKIESEPAIIKDILPAQPGEYILVSGRTGIGKSILMIHMLYCLGTGKSFFGYECRQVSAGLLIMEGDRTNIMDRIEKIKAQYPQTDKIAMDFRLETKPLNGNLDYYRDTFKGYRVVMLDNLKQVTTSERLKNHYASEWVKNFHSFLKDLGAVGIVTHHIRKPNLNSLIEPGDVYSLKGATEYVDDAATVILLEREKQQRNSLTGQFTAVNPNELTLYFAKQRIATNKTLEPINLVRNYETAGFDIAS